MAQYDKMSKKIKAHIISHTHWDREWFLDHNYTNEWLVPFFNSLFSILKKESEYRFILDGQSLIVEDYFQELRRQGKDYSKYQKILRKYCKEGRILIGPYYMQPDYQLVSGESLVRNLLIGHQISEKMGGVMKTGWLLDNFGQISQTAQIHSQFDLQGLFVWRGVEMKPSEICSEFLWESPDGTELITIYLLSSYRNAMRLGEYKEIMKERIENEVQKIVHFATTSNVLLMNGYDQEMIPDRFISHLERLSFSDIKVRQSTPEEYIEAIKKENPELSVLKGALYSGRYISVFPGTLSTRMYLKFLNDQCQRELEKYSEPLSVFSWLLVGGQYNGKALMKCWKELLKNHPHDNICGVSIDDVHTGMEKSFYRILLKSRRITRNKLTELALNIDTTSRDEGTTPYLLFNTSPWDCSKIISITNSKRGNITFFNSKGRELPQQKVNQNTYHIYVDKIPAFGYKTIYSKNKPGKSFKKQKYILSDKVIIENNKMENKFIRITIKKNGSIDVFDKINQCQYRGLGIFIDSADAGDEYNYSYPENDEIITTENRTAKIEVIEKSDLKVMVKISLMMLLPESLTEDRKSRSKKYREFPISNWITLDALSPVIKFKTVLKNTVKDHRFRVLFPSDINASYSFAGTQFDITRHLIKPKNYDNSSIPENVQRIMIGAREKSPITTFPHCFFVDINNGKRGIAVLDRDLKEYEVLPKHNTIAITLFRSIGWLARGDLLTRIGDAGPAICTPEAQCLRQMTFEYALAFHQGDCYQGKLYQLAEEFNVKPKIVKTDYHKGKLKDSNSLLRVRSKNNVLQVTALKKAERDNSVILRLFNCSPEKAEGEISTVDVIQKAYLVNLKEEIIKEINNLRGNRFRLTIKPKKIITIKFQLKKQGLVPNSKNSISRNRRNIEFLEIEGNYKINFDTFIPVQLISKHDIKQEEKRIEEIKENLEKAKKKVSSIRNQIGKNDNFNEVHSAEMNFQFHQAKGNVKTLQREVLEARLSLLLLQKKYQETYPQEIGSINLSMDKINSELRKTGYALNRARINKRAYEYIIEYYKHRLKLIREKNRGA